MTLNYETPEQYVIPTEMTEGNEAEGSTPCVYLRRFLDSAHFVRSARNDIKEEFRNSELNDNFWTV